MKPFTGVIPVLATPFRDDETLDLDSWRRLIGFLLELEVDGLTVLGVLGEANRLTDGERATLLEAAAKRVDGRVPLIAGVSHAGTHAACQLARMAQQHGATALMLAPTKEAGSSDERVLEAFARVAAACPLPLVLQDHPASTEVQMDVPLIARLVREVPSIAAIKAEAVPTAPKIRALRAALPRPLPILSGLGALYAPFDLMAGCDGFNTGFAFPEVLQALLEAQRAGDAARVHALYARHAALLVFEQQPGVAIRKEILRRRGLFASARVRHPGAALAAGAAADLDRLLDICLPGADLTRKISP
jgi:4-hydroxy-tetrahydrodipicolinate synthase